jgi:hypothetical protein
MSFVTTSDQTNRASSDNQPQNRRGPTTRLLRHKKTRLWYKSGGDWTRELTEAAHFPSAASTLEVCNEQKLRDVQMVLAFGDDIYGIAIDIHPETEGARAVAG